MSRSVKQYISGIVMTVFFAAIIVSCTNEQVSNPFGQIAQDTQDGSSQDISANKGTANLTADENEAQNDTPNASANPFTLLISEYSGTLENGTDVDYYPINKSFTDGSLASPLIRAELQFPNDNKTFKIELIKKTGNNPEQVVITWIGNADENLWVSYKPAISNDQWYLKVSSPNGSMGAYTLWCKVSANGKRYLFDVAHDQIAGNADWVIDGIDARLPTPSQLSNGLNNDASWFGNYSSVALFLAKAGHEVQSLPVGSQITAGVATPTDLQYFDVLVLSEPNKKYTASEIAAIRKFVIEAGRSVLMIGDHTTDAQNPDGSIPNGDYNGCLYPSDRNNDGWDSPRILNQILRNPNNNNYDMGLEFNLTTVANDNCGGPEITTNRAALPNINHHVNYVLRGRDGIQGHSKQAGQITGLSFYAATTIKCTGNKACMLFAEPNMPANTNNNNNCRVALSAGIGSYDGRIVAIGDSAPFNDNTGYDYDDAGSTFNSWLNDKHGNSQNHRNLLINALYWLGKVPEKGVLAP